MFCQGLNKLKRMNAVALKEMCPYMDVESLLPPGVREHYGYKGCLALCGCQAENAEEGCGQMFSCAQACKIRDLGVDRQECRFEEMLSFDRSFMYLVSVKCAGEMIMISQHVNQLLMDSLLTCVRTVRLLQAREAVFLMKANVRGVVASTEISWVLLMI